MDTFHLMLPVAPPKPPPTSWRLYPERRGWRGPRQGRYDDRSWRLATAVLDYIEVAWDLLLASMIYLVTAKCVVTGASATAGPLLIFALGAFLLNSLIACFAANQQVLRQMLHRLGAIFLLCALLFLLIIPLTVAGSAYLTRHTTAPMRESGSTSFQKIGKVFSMDRFMRPIPQGKGGRTARQGIRVEPICQRRHVRRSGRGLYTCRRQTA